MNKIQQRTVELMDKAEPAENLKPWIRGRIPKHYKRLTIPMEEAIEIAKEGATLSMAYFEDRPYFTQSLIMGASLKSKYKNIIVVTTSQYGKTYTASKVAILESATKKKDVRVVSVTGAKTEIIMGEVAKKLQEVDEDIKSRLIGDFSKLEKLQTSLSKTRIGFSTGGSIESVTLGDSTSGLKSNNAIGKGGSIIADEIDLASEDSYAELGRREYSNVDGKKELMLEISNPHNNSTFYKKLIDPVVPEDTLIIWMDIRTAIEEAKVPSKEYVMSTEFFRTQSTCQRYLLCELDDYSTDCMFGKIEVDDSPINQEDKFFIGCDSAYKGKDKIELFLSSVNTEGKVRLLDYITIGKGVWVDGVTSIRIIEDIIAVINSVQAKTICVDIGYGIWLVEGLAQRAVNFEVRSVNFGERPTKKRVELKHYSAVFGANKRVEMHLDLQQLIENQMVTATSKVLEALLPQMRPIKVINQPNGKMAITPKDEIRAVIGRSPDTLDTCVLAIHGIIINSLTAVTPLY